MVLVFSNACDFFKMQTLRLNSKISDNKPSDKLSLYFFSWLAFSAMSALLLLTVKSTNEFQCTRCCAWLQILNPLVQITALSEVVKAVAGRVEVYMDGGVRTGTDVLKALAFGARTVFIGRPIIYGLAVGVGMNCWKRIMCLYFF